MLFWKQHFTQTADKPIEKWRKVEKRNYLKIVEVLMLSQLKETIKHIS